MFSTYQQLKLNLRDSRKQENEPITWVMGDYNIELMVKCLHPVDLQDN